MGWDTPPIKNTPPSEKQPPPPMKHEVSFHEMIPRKSTININLKSGYNPSKIWVKKFILSKFAGLQAYSQQLFYKMNSNTGIFQQNFKPPMLPPCIGAAPPPMFSTPVGNPGFVVEGGGGSLRSEWKQTGGGEESNLSLCWLFEKLPDFSNSK